MPTEKPSPEEVSRALLQAIKLMNDKGAHWTRFKFKLKLEDGTHRYCAVGAIREVAAGRSNTSLRIAMYRALNAAIGKPWAGSAISPIMAWNDSESGGWEGIRGGFKKAAMMALKK